MKKFVLLLIAMLPLASVLKAQSSDPVLMTIDGQKVTKSEFEYIYNKNNTNNTIDPKTLDEYLELFKRFKLKVIDAEHRGLDTVPAFVSELAGYRAQLAKPYLTDLAVEDSLCRVAYDHLKQDVEVSHILIRLPQNATPFDTLEAYNKAVAVRKRLLKEDFGKVALEKSEDPSVTQNKGYLGFFTGMMTVYPFENAIYTLPVGEISQPIRTSYGYHIAKVISRRAARGQMRAAHIMKAINNEMTPEQQEEAHKQILAIYERVKAGEDFAELARTLSDDKASGNRGGDLSWFGVGRMVKEFEDAAFALTANNQVSEPIKSQFGWHIIKRLDRRGIDSYESKKADIMRMIQSDERAELGQRLLTERLKKEYNFKLDNAAMAEVKQYAKNKDIDSLFVAGISKLNKPLVSFSDKIVTQSEFLNFALASAQQGDDALTTVEAAYTPFVENRMIAFEDTQLERKYPDFRFLMQEYHDGILLFNISNDLVWERATRDKEGLEAYFKDNRNEYAWEKPHFKGFVIYCKDKKVEKSFKKALKSLPDDSVMTYLRNVVNVDSLPNAEASRGLWRQGENAVVDFYALKQKNAKVEPHKTLPVVFVHGRVLAKLPESYLDVRGAVTADYQNYLEEQWLDELFKKYPITVDNAVLKTVKTENR